MKPLPETEAMKAVAERVVWFKEPAAALAEPAHFLAHVMTYGTAEDLAIVRAAVPKEAFEEVLEHPPPGIFDVRSWAYWNLIVRGLSPAPPLPGRTGLQPLRPVP